MGIRSLIHQPASSPAEGKAVAFLKDTSRWRDNPLLAGEAVRALAIAAQQGHDAGDAVKTMTPTLTATANWNALKAAETDRPLMRVLFTAALAVLSEGDTSPSLALLDATKLIVADQQADGSWKTTKESIGWTTPAVTARARAALISSGRQPDDFAVAQTDRWSRTADVLTVADAAGVLLAMGVTSDVMADKQRALCLSFIRRGQQADGGWMPSADAPADAATTALALQALQQYASDPRLARSTYRAEELADAITRGRSFLAAQQKPDGSWSDVATTSWALVALLMR